MDMPAYVFALSSESEAMWVCDCAFRLAQNLH